jgi:integrase
VGDNRAGCNPLSALCLWAIAIACGTVPSVQAAARRRAEPAPVKAADAPTRKELDATIAAWAVDARGAKDDKYIAQVCRLVEDLLEHAGRRSVAELTRDDVQQALADWRDHGRPHPTAPRKPLTGKTLNNYVASIRAFFDWCIRNERVLTNPAAGATKKKHTETTQRAFTAAEVRALIAAAERDEARDGRRKGRGNADQRRFQIDRSLRYRFLAETALRESTVSAVRVKHLDLGATPAVVRVPVRKNHRERTLPLSPDLAARLRAAVDGKPPTELVFGPTPHHRVIRGDAEDAGIAVIDAHGRAVGYHCFRRFVANHLVRSGVDAKVAQQILGHKDVATTLRAYRDAVPTEILSGASLVAAAVCGTPGGSAAGNRLDSGGRIAEDDPVTVPMTTTPTNTTTRPPAAKARNGDTFAAAAAGALRPLGPILPPPIVAPTPAIAGVGFEPTTSDAHGAEVVGLAALLAQTAALLAATVNALARARGGSDGVPQ